MSSLDGGAATLFRFESSTVSWIRRSGFVVAFLVVVLSWWANRTGWYEYRPGGTQFTVSILPVVLAVFVVGALIALRFEMAGGIICGFAAAALSAFAEHQLITSQAVIVAGALAAPAVLWFVVGLSTRPRTTALVGVGLAAAAVAAGFGVGRSVYENIWGPTHPESTLTELPESEVEWAWSGAVSESSARVTVKTTGDDRVRLIVSEDPGLEAGRTVEPESVDAGVATFSIGGLQPATGYHYAVEVDGRLDSGRRGRFSTFPTGPTSIRLAVGSCARVGSNGAVFDAIAATDPLLYVITGDFHYGDIAVEDRGRFEEVLDLTLTRPAQSELYRSVPIAYVWDDHDYGFDNGSALSAGRAAAMDVYRTYVPSYPLAGRRSSVHQSFTVGRVRVILTDARSARIPGVTMLGAEQKEWLINELETSSKTHALLLWFNPVPWVGDTGDDMWAGFPDERAEIAEVIADNDIENLVMIAGDAHMVAYDDGSNTNYSSEPGPGFPLLHAAALDRPGSIKGGPYSGEVVEGGGQFGLVDITDDGSSVSVRLEARNWRNETIFGHDFTPRLPAALAR